MIAPSTSLLDDVGGIPDADAAAGGGGGGAGDAGAASGSDGSGGSFAVPPSSSHPSHTRTQDEYDENYDKEGQHDGREPFVLDRNVSTKIGVRTSHVA